jgi:hypothetical protein
LYATVSGVLLEAAPVLVLIHMTGSSFLVAHSGFVKPAA